MLIRREVCGENHFVIGQLVSNNFHVLMPFTPQSYNNEDLGNGHLNKEDPLSPSDRIVETKLDKICKITATSLEQI